MFRRSVLPLVLALALFSVGACTSTTPTVSAPVRSGPVGAASGSFVPDLEGCKAYILQTAQFEGSACVGFAEDSTELASTFERVSSIMLACVEREIAEGIICTYGDDVQQTWVYRQGELGNVAPLEGGSNV